jgi:hypothetical protein
MTGDLIVVLGSVIGTAAERNCTGPPPERPEGTFWDTTTTAVTRAPNAPIRRSLVTMASPQAQPPLGGVYKSARQGTAVNKNLFYLPSTPRRRRGPGTTAAFQ